MKRRLQQCICTTVMETQRGLSAEGPPVSVEEVVEQFAELEAAGRVGGELSMGDYHRLDCIEKVCYLPSQRQRRGSSYAESKAECQPAKHCKLYSSKIPDGARDRKAHGLCPQAQPLRTSRLDHDPGRLSSWTASLGGL